MDIKKKINQLLGELKNLKEGSIEYEDIEDQILQLADNDNDYNDNDYNDKNNLDQDIVKNIMITNDENKNEDAAIIRNRNRFEQLVEKEKKYHEDNKLEDNLEQLKQQLTYNEMEENSEYAHKKNRKMKDKKRY